MNTAIVATTAATVSPFIQNLQQQQQQKPQTSKEAIAANVKALIEQLEEGHSEGLTAYLMAMGRFHNYSFGNILEIARQKPSATRVAGMYAWNQLGRRVNKGEKGTRTRRTTMNPNTVTEYRNLPLNVLIPSKTKRNAVASKELPKRCIKEGTLERLKPPSPAAL
jgi:hypothetical protein